MNVLMLNGSRREKGCTFTALNEIAGALSEEGIDSEIVFVGQDAVNGNIDSLVKDITEKMKTSDGLIVGSPVYFAGASGEIISVLDRLFISGEKYLRLKPAAAIVSARRAGTTAAIDQINKYFLYAEMPLISSRYWNMVHGSNPNEVMKDEEGIQIMRVLGKNMAWVIKSIEAGKNAGIVCPEAPKKVFTNFIR